MRLHAFINISLLATLFWLITSSTTRAEEVISSQLTQITQTAQKTIHLITQYEHQLGIYKNPFLYTFTVDEANNVYNALLWRSEGFFCGQSPLFKIQQEIKQPHKKSINLPLIGELINDSEQLLLPQAQPTQRDLQSNLLALKTVLEYLQQFIASTVIEEGSSTTTSTNQKVTSDLQKQQENNIDTPDEYPELNDFYTPQTDDLTESSSTGKKRIIIETTVDTSLFGQISYSTLIRNHPKPLQVSPRLDELKNAGLSSFTTAINNNDSTHTMLVHPMGKTHVKLFMPPGYMPARNSIPQGSIEERRGSYTLTINTHNNNNNQKTNPSTDHSTDSDTIEIPLISLPNRALTTLEQELYTSPAGFALDEWPEAIQTEIIHRYHTEEHDTKTIAQAIRDHIAHTYSYSKKEQAERDPIDALTSGKFQCDMAAYIMASLLRDVYHIPARVIGGYTAQRRIKDSTKRSYLVLPDTAHAWVEVFYDNSWHVYDPTPLRSSDNDQNGQDNQKKDSEYTRVPPQTPDTPPQQRPDNSSTGSNSTNSTKKTDQEQQQKIPEESTNSTTTDQTADQNSNELYVLPELNELLAQFINTQLPDTNALRRVLLQQLLTDVLNPVRSSELSLHKLSLVKTMYQHYESSLKLITEALKLHKEPHEPLLQWLKELYNLVFTQDITTTYRELMRIAKILSLYTKTVDTPVIKNFIDTLVNDLVNAITVLQPLKDPHAAEIALVDDFKKTSPHLLWKLIEKEYNLATPGPNLETHTFAQDIKSGKHNDKLLINYLYPYTNFILNATPRQGTVSVKSWLREQRKAGRDILPLQRVDDWKRAFIMQPQLDLIENIRQQTAYVLTKRKQIAVPSTRENNEAERITIVGFDTSGSMAGENSKFQAALIASFVSRALNDISPLGKQRHRVLLVPFDHEVGQPIPVTTITEALDLITNHQRLLANTGGGTNIQEFLLQAMKLIAEAQDRKNPFESANIILMTDGEAPVDYQELKKARQAIHRETPLQTMFIALSNSNQELMKFAHDSPEMGTGQGFYKEFSDHEISKILSEAATIDVKKYESYYFSSQEPQRVPPVIRQHLAQAISTSELLALELHRLVSSANYDQYLTQLAALQPQELYNRRPVEQWVYQVRQLFATHPVFRDTKLTTYLLAKLMERFSEITNLDIRDLSYYETEQLTHLLKNPLAG